MGKLASYPSPTITWVPEDCDGHPYLDQNVYVQMRDAINVSRRQWFGMEKTDFSYIGEANNDLRGASEESGEHARGMVKTLLEEFKDSLKECAESEVMDVAQNIIHAWAKNYAGDPLDWTEAEFDAILSPCNFLMAVDGERAIRRLIDHMAYMCTYGFLGGSGGSYHSRTLEESVCISKQSDALPYQTWDGWGASSDRIWVPYPIGRPYPGVSYWPGTSTAWRRGYAAEWSCEKQYYTRSGAAYYMGHWWLCLKTCGILRLANCWADKELSGQLLIRAFMDGNNIDGHAIVSLLSSLNPPSTPYPGMTAGGTILLDTASDATVEISSLSLPPNEDLYIGYECTIDGDHGPGRSTFNSYGTVGLQIYGRNSSSQQWMALVNLNGDN